MTRIVRTRKSGVFCLLLIALAAVTASDRPNAESSKNQNADSERLVNEMEPELQEWIDIMDAVGDERAARAYEQRVDEAPPWIKEARLPNPDNAALLYYQAFLLRPEPNMATSLKISQILKGAEPDRQMRIYLGHCLPVIRVAEIASQIPQCAWGLWYEAEAEFGINSLSVQTRHLTFILAVDARTLAADGHCRAALARCLTIRHLARHIGDETIIAYLVSTQTDTMALDTLQHVLGVVPPDADTLTWFQGQLAVVRGAPPAICKALQADFEGVLHNLRTNPNYLRKLRTVLVEKAEDAQTAKEARNLTDEELLARARQPYRHFLNSVFRVMASNMPCEWKHARIKGLKSKLEKEYGGDLAAASVISVCAGRLPEWYELQVEHQAHINGIKAAVEIYLIVAETGQLPEKLPDHLPKDPFTGRDFVYEITDEGFALRCQGKEFRSRSALEFKLRR